MATTIDHPPSHSLASRLRGEALWVAALRGVGIAAAFALNVLLVRLLSKADYGEFVSLSSGLWFASLLAGGGIDHAIVRNVGRSLGRDDTHAARSSLWSGLLAGFAISGVVALGTAILAMFGALPNSSARIAELPWILIGANVALTAALQLLAASLRSLQDLRLSSAIAGPNGGPIGTCLFAAMALALWWYAHLNLTGVIAGCTFAMGLMIVPTIFVIRNRANRVWGRSTIALPAMNLVVLSFVTGLPLLAGDLLAYVVSQLDLWIIWRGVSQSQATPAELADFANAKRLALLAIMPVVIVNQTILASIPALHEAQRREDLQKLLSQSAWGAFAASAAFLLLLMVSADRIVSLIAGPEYSRSAPILIALVAGQTVVAAFAPAGITLLMTGHARTHCLIQLCAAVLLACGGPHVLVQFGPLGLAIAWGATAAVSQFVSYLAAARLCGVKPGILG